jgi:hypothetical protein
MPTRAHQSINLCSLLLAMVFMFGPGVFAQNMNADSGPEIVLFDFAKPTKLAWQIVNDDVMGGISKSRFTLTNGTAVFSGSLSLENNGGFASVRTLPTRLDAGNAEAFVIRVRGDGRRYKFTARTDASFDSAIYQCDFATRRDEWEEIRLPLKKFVASFRGRTLPHEPPLTAARLKSVGFLIADRQAGEFRLEISWIKTLNP